MKNFISEREAWKLFQIAAISEAFSWLLLLAGMLIKYVIRPGDDTWVAVGGSIHGIVFIAYAVAVLGLRTILGLTFLQTIVAAIASVVPFGTLVYERWLAAKRYRHSLGSYRQVVVRAVITEKQHTFVIQQADVGFWCLPGGKVNEAETAEQALQRNVNDQTGITPQLGQIVYTNEYDHRGVRRLELFYLVTNVAEYSAAYPLEVRQERAGLDSVAWLILTKNIDLKPAFLQQM